MSFDHFNPTEYQPNQGTPKHPVGKFPARIFNTEVVPLKDNKGCAVRVHFETPQGKIHKQYNVDTTDSENQRISREQFAALHYACGLSAGSRMTNSFRELVNGQCVIEVTPQTNNDKYNEVSCVYDMRGELPKAGAPINAQAAPFNPTQPQPPFGGPSPAPTPFALGGPSSPPVNPAIGQPFGNPANPNAAMGFPPGAPQPGNPPPFQPQPMQPPLAQPVQWPNQGQPPQQPAWANPQNR